MIIFSIVIFITSFFIILDIWEKGQKKQERRTQDYTLDLIAKEAIAGVLIFWTKNLWLYPMIKVFTENTPEDKAVFTAVVMIFCVVAYAYELIGERPRILFLVGAFFANCLMVTILPKVAIAIMFAFVVTLYSMIQNKTVKVSAIEVVLICTMFAIAGISVIFEKMGIFLSIFILLTIIVMCIAIVLKKNKKDITYATIGVAIIWKKGKKDSTGKMISVENNICRR